MGIVFNTAKELLRRNLAVQRNLTGHSHVRVLAEIQAAFELFDRGLYVKGYEYNGVIASQMWTP
jgi:hypothetical protein